jgi:hypothetical protein
MSKECQFCRAQHWLQEASPPQSHNLYESCCKKGEVDLPLLGPVPDYLRALYEAQDACRRVFCQHIRSYNSALAFTSVSYNKDTRLDLSRSLHCFQIHGELYHYQGPLVLGSQEVPRFAQLFFYDLDYATNIHADQYPQLDRSILRQLTVMLTDCSPFIKIYETAEERLYA